MLGLRTLPSPFVHEYFDVHAPVELAALSIAVTGDWLRTAEANRHEDASERDVLFTEITGDGSRAFFAQLSIGFRGESVGRVARDLDHVTAKRFRNIGKIGKVPCRGFIEISRTFRKEDIHLKLVLVVIQVLDKPIQHSRRGRIFIREIAGSLCVQAGLIR